MSTEAMKLAEALQYLTEQAKTDYEYEIVEVLKEALAKQEQGEPVAWMVTTEMNNGTRLTYPLSGRYKDVCDACDFGEPLPLYIHPQPKQEQEVPEGYKLVLVPNESPTDEPDWDECIRQAEVSTGLKVERHTLSIVIREVRRWLLSKQEPVALKVYHGELCYKSQADDQSFGMWCPVTQDFPFPEGTKFYTTPQQRTWVELTDEQINQAYADSYKGIPLHEGIAAKLKENNT